MRQTEIVDLPIIKRGDTFEEMVLVFFHVDKETGVKTPLDIATFCMQAKIYANGKAAHTFEGQVFEGNKIRLFRHTVTLGARIYVYDLEITETDGTRFTWIEGKIIVKQDVSDGCS